MADLLSELRTFKVKYPGNDEVLLRDSEKIAKFTELYFDDWKGGKVVSVPPVRDPRIFLAETEVTKSKKKKLKTLYIGEKGEIQVYRKLLNLSPIAENHHNGLLIFPNFNGNLKFSSQAGKVEIDCIILHVSKGVFILSIKNAQNIDLDEICDDLRKHKAFLRALCDFSTSNPEAIPIHGIVCSMRKNIDRKSLEANNFFSADDAQEKQHFFMPDKQKSFEANMIEIISDSHSLTEERQKILEVLASRLIVLNSMEGSIAVFHNKMIQDKFQLVKVKKDKKRKPEEPSTSKKPGASETPGEPSSLKTLAGALESIQNDKKRSILWTKEQFEAISIFYEKMLSYYKNNQQNGFRLLVHGPKGSGKTMLLRCFALIAKSLFKNNIIEKDLQIVVCDGRRGQSRLLLDHFYGNLSPEGVQVLSGCFQIEKIKSADLVLVDEFLCFLGDRTIRQVDRSQNCVIFSADNCLSLFDAASGAEESFAAYLNEPLYLNASLRSNLGITKFVGSFRDYFDSQNFEFGAFRSKIGQMSCRWGHNLEGSPPHIKIVSASDFDNDPLQLTYVKVAANKIHETVKKSAGLDSVLVVLYLHSITIGMIIEQLKAKNIEYEYRNPIDIFSSQTFSGSETSTTRTKPTLPKVVLLTGHHLDGAEFGSVVVLLERSLPQSWNEFLFDRLFVTFTRATIDLSIVVNDSPSAPLLRNMHTKISCKSDGQFSLSDVTDFNEDYNHRAYEWLNATSANLEQKLIDVIQKCLHSLKGPVILVGNVPDASQLVECDSSGTGYPESIAKNFKWFTFVGQNRKLGVLDDPSTFRLVNHSSVKFSALVLVAKSEEEYFAIHQNITYYILLYQMHQKQLLNSPIYFITSFKTKDSDTEINRICQFLSERSEGKTQSNRGGEKVQIGTAELDDEHKKAILKRMRLGRLITPAYRLRDCLEYLSDEFDRHISEIKQSGTCEADAEVCELNDRMREVRLELVEQATELADMFCEASQLHANEDKKKLFKNEAAKYREKERLWKAELEH